MIVEAIAFGDARAYRASPTGMMLAKPALLSTSKARTQPKLALRSGVANVLAIARARMANMASTNPMIILLISLGSLKCLAHRRQKASAITRKLIETIESTVISHVVGMVCPKNTMLMWLGTQSM